MRSMTLIERVKIIKNVGVIGNGQPICRIVMEDLRIIQKNVRQLGRDHAAPPANIPPLSSGKRKVIVGRYSPVSNEFSIRKVHKG